MAPSKTTRDDFIREYLTDEKLLVANAIECLRNDFEKDTVARDCEEIREHIWKMIERHARQNFERVYMVPQAKFMNLNVNGSYVRADAVFWIPTDKSMKLVLECDGFETHGTREKFTSDRQRDRAFMNAGYTVRRYSGAEIWRDPIQCSTDLFGVLWPEKEAK